MSDTEKKSSEKSDSQDLEELFVLYSQFGDKNSEGTITLSNVDRWMKQAGIVDVKGDITKTDTAITFTKVMKTSKRMNFDEFKEFIEILASDKRMEPEELFGKLTAAGEPEITGVTKPILEGAVGRNVRRMTDVKLYTGSHKERFDDEGKGKGIAGREDIMSNTGFVSGYKKEEGGKDKAAKKSPKEDEKGKDDKKKKK